MAWQVEVTDEFLGWYQSLSDRQMSAVEAAVEKLEERGPGLGRPIVGEVVNDLISHLKELIPPGGNLRVLFVFDPRRTAVLLLGGDKTGDWKGWYQSNIPLAKGLYDRYLEETQQRQPAVDGLPQRGTAGMATRKWADVRRKAADDEPARQAYRDAIEDTLELAKIRERLGITQIEMATRLGITQGNVSRLERREDVYLSTIREYVEALGGQLKVVAAFPDAEIPIARGGEPVAQTRHPR